MDAIVSMSGRLGTEVESRISRNGAEYAKFRLATSQRFLREGVWVDGETTWVGVRCFRQLGVNATLSLRKGQPVVVVGRLRVENWVTDTGVVRESTVLDALAVGHDLNWGVTRFGRLEKERTESQQSEQTSESFVRGGPGDDVPPLNEADEDFDRECDTDEVEFEDSELAERLEVETLHAG